MNILKAALIGLSAAFVQADCPACDKEHCKLLEELPVIKKAAARNGCKGDDFIILLAIRKAENGRPGLEFGILHPKALKLIKNEPERSLDIQAGWCAATIVKNRARWEKTDKKEDFITFLGGRYCPVGAENDPDGLNKNWIKNVKYWFNKLKGLK